MEIITQILNACSKLTPVAVIAFALVIIFMLVRKEELPSILTKKPRDKESSDMSKVLAALDKIANNHLHELPDIRHDVTSILDGQKELVRIQNEQGQRLARVEGVLKINLR